MHGAHGHARPNEAGGRPGCRRPRTHHAADEPPKPHLPSSRPIGVSIGRRTRPPYPQRVPTSRVAALHATRCKWHSALDLYACNAKATWAPLPALPYPLRRPCRRPPGRGSGSTPEGPCSGRGRQRHRAEGGWAGRVTACVRACMWPEGAGQWRHCTSLDASGVHHFIRTHVMPRASWYPLVWCGEPGRGAGQVLLALYRICTACHGNGQHGTAHSRRKGASAHHAAPPPTRARAHTRAEAPACRTMAAARGYQPEAACRVSPDTNAICQFVGMHAVPKPRPGPLSPAHLNHTTPSRPRGL